jgi:polyvinyl alcohol dehydrogenase (cytochrome)
VKACLNDSSVADKSTCREEEDASDSIIALDQDTGVILWKTSPTYVDSYTLACVSSGGNICGGDYDFAQGPMLTTIDVNGSQRQVVIAGQKSGVVWCLNAETGDIVWSKATDHGSAMGGIMWGSAVDSSYVYIANTNSVAVKHKTPAGAICNQGFWSCLDKNTGSIIWETCDPYASRLSGPVTVVQGGVMFGGSMDSRGGVFGLSTNTGEILWKSDLGASIGGGASITDGYVLWGGGYPRSGGAASLGYYFVAFKLTSIDDTSTTTPSPSITATPASTSESHSTYAPTDTLYPTVSPLPINVVASFSASFNCSTFIVLIAAMLYSLYTI